MCVPLRCHFLHFEITVIDSMENNGVFNRQWKLRPIGPCHIDSLSHQCITTPKIIAGSCSAGCRKGKNGWETTEERQRIVLKRTGYTCNYKGNVIFLWLGGGSIKRNRGVSGQNGRDLFLLVFHIAASAKRLRAKDHGKEKGAQGCPSRLPARKFSSRGTSGY